MVFLKLGGFRGRYRVAPKRQHVNPVVAAIAIVGLLEFIKDEWVCEVEDRRSGRTATGYGKTRGEAKQNAFRKLRSEG